MVYPHHQRPLNRSVYVNSASGLFLKHGCLGFLFALCDIPNSPDLTQMMITTTVAGLIVLTYVRSARNWGTTAVAGSTNY